jgi:hypothetical protein
MKRRGEQVRERRLDGDAEIRFEGQIKLFQKSDESNGELSKELGQNLGPATEERGATGAVRYQH